jgi:hypothetical protein
MSGPSPLQQTGSGPVTGPHVHAAAAERQPELSQPTLEAAAAVYVQ